MRVRASTVVLFACVLPTCAATFAQCGGERAAAAPAARLQVPQDRVRILVSGTMEGRLEPCGCASGQLGGLARRMQHIGEQRTYDLLLEGGDLVAGGGPLDAMKLMTASQVLFAMQHRYDALGIGPRDLLVPAEDRNLFLAGAPVVASDLESTDPAWPGQPFVHKEVRGIGLRVASLLLELPPAARAPEAGLTHLPPAAAWRRALVGTDDATRRILLVHGSDAAIRTLIPELQPAPDLVVGVDPAWIEPSATPSLIGSVPLVFAGTRGRVLLDLWLHRTDQGPQVTCALVPLAASKTAPGGGGDPQVKDVLLAHRQEVKDHDVLGAMMGQLPTPNGAAYVGSETCRTCHPSAFAAFEKSRHFHAWQTLVDAERDPKRYGWPVTAYPDCVSCHVVGFAEVTGFRSFDETPHLAGVGCERCHGPGSDHLLAPEKHRLGIRGGIRPSELCVQCHDFEQSPTFLYGDKWALIQHGREPHQQRAGR